MSENICVLKGFVSVVLDIRQFSEDYCKWYQTTSGCSTGIALDPLSLTQSSTCDHQHMINSYSKIFYCYLATPRPPFGHFLGNSLTQSLLITVLFKF